MKAIHHIDGDPYNNDPSNLRVVTVKESFGTLTRNQRNNQSKCCPACGRPFAPAFDAGGPVSQAIYDFISQHPEGVTREQVISHVYRDREDGGPEWANGISVLIHKLNLKLTRKNIRIKSRGGPGAVYKLIAI